MSPPTQTWTRLCRAGPAFGSDHPSTWFLNPDELTVHGDASYGSEFRAFAVSVCWGAYQYLDSKYGQDRA
jgi:hypothetical protein